MRERQEQGALSGMVLTRLVNVAAGIVLALALCLTGLALGAWLISEGRLEPGSAQAVRLLAVLLGCFGGGCFAALREGRQALILSGGVSGGFLLVWLVLGAAVCGEIDPKRAGLLTLTSAFGAFLAGITGAVRKNARSARK